MLSLFFAVLLIAAGSNASLCKPRSVSPATSASGVNPTGYPSGSQQLSLHRGTGNTLQNAVNNSPGTQTVNGPGPGAQPGIQQLGSGSNAPPSTPSGGPAAPGSCPPGFLNTVFNTNAPAQGGWPQTVWSSLSSNGINNWRMLPSQTLSKFAQFSNNAIV